MVVKHQTLDRNASGFEPLWYRIVPLSKSHYLITILEVFAVTNC